MENILLNREDSIFCVDQDMEESADSNMSEMAIDCGNSSEMTPLGLVNEPRQISETAEINSSLNGNRDVVNISNNVAASVIMGEDGGMYQCFPISEREMFIVSLDDHPNLMASNSGIENNLFVKQNRIIDRKLNNKDTECSESFSDLLAQNKTSEVGNVNDTIIVKRGDIHSNDKPIYRYADQHILEKGATSSQSAEKVKFHILTPESQFQNIDESNRFLKFENNDKSFLEKEEKVSYIINSKYIEKNTFEKNETKENYIIDYKDTTMRNKEGIISMHNNSFPSTSKHTPGIDLDQLNTEPRACNQISYLNNNKIFISPNDLDDLHSDVPQTMSQSCKTSYSSNTSQPMYGTSPTTQASLFASHGSSLSNLTSNDSKSLYADPDKSQVSQVIPSTSGIHDFNSNTKSTPINFTKSNQSSHFSLQNSQSTCITPYASKSSASTANKYSQISKKSFDHKLFSNTDATPLKISSHLLETTPTLVKVSKVSLASSSSTQDGSSPTEVRNLPVLEWYKCHICFSVLPSSLTLRHHLVHQHQLKKIEAHVCFLCSMECWSLAQLECHLRIHHGVRNAALTCHVCGTQLASVTECRAHTRKHERSVSCPLCQEKFCAQHQLLIHIQEIHLPKVRPHLCIVCGKRFKHTSTLRLHRWRHTMQVCSQENCTHKVVDEGWFVEHLQKHHKMSPQIVSDIFHQRDKADKQADLLYSNYQHVCLEKEEITKQMEICNRDLENTVDDQFFQNKEINNRITQTDKERDPVFFHKDNLTINSFFDEESDNYLRFSRENVQLDPTYVDPEVNNTVISLVESIAEFEEKSNKNNKINSVHRDEFRRNLENNEEEIIDRILCDKSRVYRCGLCNIYLVSAEELEKHKMTHEQVSCTLCNKNFQSRKLMRRHLATHAGLKNQNKDYTFTCLECQKCFASESALSKHSKIHSKSLGRFQCPDCKRRVKTQACLTEHLARVHKIYSEALQYHCPICERKFTSEVYLKQHMLRHGEGSLALWNCDKCDRRFQRPRALHKHLANHDKMHHCLKCQKQFTHIKKLTTHMRTHNPDMYERHECVECDLKFSYKSQLLVHLRTHTDERPFVCENCGKSFKRLQHCQVHYRIAHSNIKNICPECGKTFTDKDNLMRHRLMVHYKLKRWICGICALHYAYPQDLRNHLKKQHNWVLDRVQGTNKKSRDQPVVVPELGEYQISAEVKLNVRKIYEEVSRKIRKLVDSQTVILNNTAVDDDPDDPMQVENDIDSGPEVTGDGMTVKGLEKNPDISSKTIVSDLTSDGVVGCGSGGEALCVVCQVTLCCERHMEVHMVRQHHLQFQCSLCGLNYASQQLCVDHVSTQHPDHVLALQAGNMIQQNGADKLQGTTGIATIPNFMTQQPTFIAQDGNSSILASTAVVPSQLCLVQQQNGELVYCLVQPQQSQQVPVWIQQTPQIIGEQPSVETSFVGSQGAIGGQGTVLQLNGSTLPVGGVLGQRSVGQMSIVGGQFIGNHGNVIGCNQQQGLYLTTTVQNTASVVGGNNMIFQYPVVENFGSSISLIPTMPVAVASSAVVSASEHSNDHSAAPVSTADTTHQTHSPLVTTADEQHEKQSINDKIENITRTNISIRENPSIPSATHSTEVLDEFLTSNNNESQSHISSHFRQRVESPLIVIKEETNSFEQTKTAPLVFEPRNHEFSNSKYNECAIVTPQLLPHNSDLCYVEKSKEKEQEDPVYHVIKSNKETTSETSSQTVLSGMSDPSAGALLTLAETCSNPLSVFGIQHSSRNQNDIESDNSVQISNAMQNETKNVPKAENVSTFSSYNSKIDLIPSTFNKDSLNFALSSTDFEGSKINNEIISDNFDTGVNNNADTQNIHILNESSKQCPEQDLVLEIIQRNKKYSPEKSPSPHKKIKKKKSVNYNFWRNQSETVARGLYQIRSADEESILTNESTATFKYSCQTCGKKFNTSNQLERHGKIHREKRFPCEECGKTFTENFNLKTHMITHTKERPHQCSFCSKSFRYQRDLNDHKKTHEGIRPHECKECQRTFVRRRDWLRHVRELHGNQRYKCPVCGQSFLRKVYLEMVHLPTHDEHNIDATYNCINCKRKFVSARALKEHSAEHNSNEKQRQLCGVCGRTFSKARYLTAHLRVHHKRKNYVRCSFCPRMFTSEATLKSHEDAFHLNHGQATNLNKTTRKSQRKSRRSLQDFGQVQSNDELSGRMTSSGTVPHFESALVSMSQGDHSVPKVQQQQQQQQVLSSGHQTIPAEQHSGNHGDFVGQHITSVDQHTSHEQHAYLTISDTNMHNMATISVTNISDATNINHLGTMSSTNLDNSTSSNVHLTNECDSIDYFNPTFYSPNLLEKQT